MPSPRTAKLQVLIRGTKWLQPVPVPLELPAGILPGRTIRVPGELRALVKNEVAPRESGTLLRAHDTVSLRAYAMRLQRDVPEFRGGVAVIYQYPLLMTTPKYLDCVAKGDTVRFSWTVCDRGGQRGASVLTSRLQIQNISTKSQGRKGALTRETGTHLSDPKGLFDLKRADPATPHDITDMVDCLGPGETAAVAVEFQVSDLVEEFTTGNMLASLLLSDPLTGKLRVVVTFDLRIQISPSYRYNPAARFLLVVNASTPNAFVLQLIHFIQFGLHLAVDLFNLSLSGSFNTPDTGQDVLPNYSGKTILILGNTMNYFQDGTREPWELMDVAQTFRLASEGTTFLVIAPSNTTSLRGFAHLLEVPGAVVEDGSREDASSLKDMLVRYGSGTSRALPTTPIIVPVKKQVLRDLHKSVSSAAKSTQRKLSDMFPLRTFLVAPCDVGNDDPKSKRGALIVAEGLPHKTKFVAALQPFQAGPQQPAPVLSEYNMAMITHSMPFADQCAMFWNLVGVDTTFGVPRDVVYARDRLAHLEGDEREDAPEEQLVSGKVRLDQPPLKLTACLIHQQACEALTWSIAAQLASELTQFALGRGTSQSGLLAQLPLLRGFISSAPNEISSGATGAFAPLASVLGHIRGVASPLSFGQWLGQVSGEGKRRRRVQAVVLGKVSEPLVKRCKGSPMPKPSKKDAAEMGDGGTLTKPKSAAEEVVDVERKRKKELGEIKRKRPHLNAVARAHELACMVLEELTKTKRSRFLDLLNGFNDPGSQGKGHSSTVTVMSKADYGQLKQRHEQRRTRLAGDSSFSQNRLRHMVTKAPGLDERPISSGRDA